MIDLDKVFELTKTPVIREFAEFVGESAKGRKFPDYKSLDLMQVPRLIPRFFIFDYRPGVEKGLLLHYSGTGLDRFFGLNITGKYAEDVYVGSDNAHLVLDLYRRGFETEKHCYALRTVQFRDYYLDRDKVAESILFQCSSDDETLDYAMGYAHYIDGDGPKKGRYEWF